MAEAMVFLLQSTGTTQPKSGRKSSKPGIETKTVWVMVQIWPHNEIDVILKVASILPILVRATRVKVKGSQIEGYILSKLITRKLIIKAGRIPHSIRGQENVG